ncbi:hypothetical protein YC2023_011427 [Brassica napus]
MALITMVRLNYTNLIFETDCKELVQALYEKNGHPSIHVYIQDIQHLLAKIGHHRIRWTQIKYPVFGGISVDSIRSHPDIRCLGYPNFFRIFTDIRFDP